MLDICMPVYKSIDVRTFVSFFVARMPPQKRLFVEHGTTGDIAKARNEIVKKILESKEQSAFSLWIDSDVSFDSEAVAMLGVEMQTRRNICGVITGLTRGRTDPHDIVCMIRTEDGLYHGAFSSMRGSEIPRDVMEIDACGADFMMVNNDVFRRYGCDFTRREGLTEDLSFCERVKEAGFKILAHGGVRIGHQAEVTLTV